MPANLTPEYFAAERQYKAAKTRSEKMACLEKMLSVIPKHKGTDKLQGDIKRRLAQLRTRVETEQVRRRKGFSLVVKREGAGKVVVVGHPNVGKSQLVSALTNARPEVADYPFTTRTPMPGMISYKDIRIQLLDLPAVSPQHTDACVTDNTRVADIVLLVVDSAADDPLSQIDSTADRLRQAKIILTGAESREDKDTGLAYVQTLIVANKSDEDESGEMFNLLKDLWDGDIPMIAVSALTGANLEELKGRIFDMLGIIRVYSKIPGKRLEKSAPYTLKRGSTLLEFAEAVHREIAERLKFGKVWGSGSFPGQSVGPEYTLEDGDIVELHS